MLPNTLSHETLDLIETGRKYFVPNYKPREMILDHGKGARLWDRDGNEYLDFGAGIAVNSLGHAHPKLVAALKTQADKLWHTSNVYFTEPSIHLAEALVTRAPHMLRAFFCNSGAEANEAAIKLARKYASKTRPPEKRNIITFTGSFHGRTLATVTATAQPKYHEGFEPLPPGFIYLPFNDAGALEAAFDDSICAVLVEPLQGEGGIVPAAPGFLLKIQELCRQHNALLMLDEVQCGMGRTGKLFAYEHEEELKPDVVTLAKALGCGIPVGAMLVGERAGDVLQFGSHGTTFGGNPLATSVAKVAVDELSRPDVLAHVARQGLALMQGLRDTGAAHGLFSDVRGRGLMIGAELSEKYRGKSAELAEACRQERVLVLQAGPNVLRLLPPLILTDEELQTGLAAIARGIAAFVTGA